MSNTVRRPPITPWDDDPGFLACWNQASTHTRVEKPSCYILYQLAGHVAALPGDAAEVGVYKGGSARLLALAGITRSGRLHLFDTFAGMPPVDSGKDIFREGDFGDTSLDLVAAYLGDLANIELHPGLFPGTAESLRDPVFRFVHVDADIYTSVHACCAYFYPRLVAGGVMVFDDYGYAKCPGAKMAVDEFFRDTPEKPCYLPTGQALVIRHPAGAAASAR